MIFTTILKEDLHMPIVLFAIIGSIIKAPAIYWVCYGVYCVARLAKILYELAHKY